MAGSLSVKPQECQIVNREYVCYDREHSGEAKDAYETAAKPEMQTTPAARGTFMRFLGGLLPRQTMLARNL